MFLQETFLYRKDESKIAEIKDHGLQIYSCPRVGKLHGGLAVIYKPSINLKCQKKVVKYNSFEYMETTLKTDHDLLRFINIYRPPYNNISNKITNAQYLNEFEEFLETMPTKTGVPILLGDFNIHVEHTWDLYAKKLKDIIEQFHLTQHVPESRLTHRLVGTLDLIITPETINDKLTNLDILDHGTESDHFMIEFRLCYNKKRCNNTEKELYYRNFKNIDIDQIRTIPKHQFLQQLHYGNIPTYLSQKIFGLFVIYNMAHIFESVTISLFKTHH